MPTAMVRLTMARSSRTWLSLSATMTKSGTYTAGTDADFFDFNTNGMRDAADGKFNGVLCSDTTGRCGGPTTRSTGIGAQNVIVMSGSTPMVTRSAGAPLAPISHCGSAARSP